MKPLPTIRDIADALGIHHTTVSRALRNDPRISPSRRAEVQAKAEALGYRAHPLLSALMLHRTTRRPLPAKANLALLIPHSPLASGRHHLRMNEAAIKARAGELGYHAETFIMEEYQDLPAELLRIWRSRGILGVILETVVLDDLPRPVDVSGMACVCVGVAHARLPVVKADHFGGLLLAWDEMLRLGYKRPGLYLHSEIELFTRGAWTAAFLLKQRALPASARIPVHIGSTGDDWQKWFSRFQPDVLLNNSWRTIHGDCPTIVLDCFRPNETGIDQQRTEIARAAVDLVTMQLTRNERGTPRCPQQILIPPKWQAGGRKE